MKKVLWFTGLSGSGKTTIAEELQRQLDGNVEILDGDVVRDTLHKTLGFSREDIRENNRLIAELAAKSTAEVVLVPIISPYREDRAMAKSIIGEGFTEVYISTSLQECQQRDVKGLYHKAAHGEITNMIGVAESNPYEIPLQPDIVVSTTGSVAESVQTLRTALEFSPETRLAMDAIQEAGKAILELYGTDCSSTVKEDDEPVTEADLASNDILLQRLANTYPILSEESEDTQERLQHERVWIVDPLDGTSDFVNKTGEFTVMVALVENNVPIIGVVYWPTEKTLFVAENGKGAYKIRHGTWTKIQCGTESELSKVRALGSRHHLSEREKEHIAALQLFSFMPRGSSLKVMEICQGNAELYFTLTNKIKQWDTAASHCIITEAGGMMTDTRGHPLLYNTPSINHEHGILVTNGQIHQKIVETLE